MMLFRTSWRERFDATKLLASASKLGFQAMGWTDDAAYFDICFVYVPGEKRSRLDTAHHQFVELLCTHAAGRFVSLVATNENRETEAATRTRNEDG